MARKKVKVNNFCRHFFDELTDAFLSPFGLSNLIADSDVIERRQKDGSCKANEEEAR